VPPFSPLISLIIISHFCRIVRVPCVLLPTVPCLLILGSFGHNSFLHGEVRLYITDHHYILLI